MAVVPVQGEKVSCGNCGLGFMRPITSTAVECPFCEKLGEGSLVRKIRQGGDGCKVFTRCDLYGHSSRAVIRCLIRGTQIPIVVCTWRSRKGKVCGREYIAIVDAVKRR